MKTPPAEAGGKLVLRQPLGLKAELPRMNAGAPTPLRFSKPRIQTPVFINSLSLVYALLSAPKFH